LYSHAKSLRHMQSCAEPPTWLLSWHEASENTKISISMYKQHSMC